MEKLHDIYGVWHVPFWQRSWFYWSMFALITCLLLILIGIAIRTYRTRKKDVHLSPWDVALQSLGQLQYRNVTTIEQGSECYVAITHILKKYLHQRYGFDVASKTDQEVVAYLEQQNFDSNLLSDIRDIFEGSVFIKFAHVHVLQERIEKDLERSVAFIKATLPVDNKK